MMKERIVFLDYVRVVACLMVIAVHACEFYYIGPDGGISIKNDYDALIVSVIDGIFHCSVPLFVMTSAYLLLPVKGASMQFFKRRAVRILIPFIVWTLLYCILPPIWGGFTLTESLKGLSRVFYNYVAWIGHMWFVYMIIGLYLFMPVLSPWLKNVSRKGEQLFLYIWLLASTYHYVKLIGGNYIWGEDFWNEFHTLYYFSGYIGYLVLAHYIRQYVNWSRMKLILSGAALIAGGSIITILITYHQMTHYEGLSFYELEIGWRFCSTNVIAITTGVFLLFKSIDHPGKIYGITEDISKLSYGMYLLHIFVLQLFLSLITPYCGTLTSVIAVGLSTFIVSYLIAKVLSFLPFGKYIVG